MVPPAAVAVLPLLLDELLLEQPAAARAAAATAAIAHVRAFKLDVLSLTSSRVSERGWLFLDAR